MWNIYPERKSRKAEFIEIFAQMYLRCDSRFSKNSPIFSGKWQ